MRFLDRGLQEGRKVVANRMEVEHDLCRERWMGEELVQEKSRERGTHEPGGEG